MSVSKIIRNEPPGGALMFSERYEPPLNCKQGDVLMFKDSQNLVRTVPVWSVSVWRLAGWTETHIMKIEF